MVGHMLVGNAAFWGSLLGTAYNMGAEGSDQCGCEECVGLGAPRVSAGAERTVGAC